MIPQFLRFYQGYTKHTILEEYLVSFYSLCSEMYRLKSKEQLEAITVSTAPHSENTESLVHSLQESAKGNQGLINQAKVIRNVVNK